jgi:hypothetical protein
VKQVLSDLLGGFVAVVYVIMLAAIAVNLALTGWTAVGLDAAVRLATAAFCAVLVILLLWMMGNALTDWDGGQ